MEPELFSHPKSPESEDDDDEVNDVGKEHECVDVGGSPILSVEDAPEEALGWMVNDVKTGEESEISALNGRNAASKTDLLMFSFKL